LTNLKRAGRSSSSKWSSATLKAPWFDDESIAALAVESVVDNDMKKPASAAPVAMTSINELMSWSPSESQH